MLDYLSLTLQALGIAEQSGIIKDAQALGALLLEERSSSSMRLAARRRGGRSSGHRIRRRSFGCCGRARVVHAVMVRRGVRPAPLHLLH